MKVAGLFDFETVPRVFIVSVSFYGVHHVIEQMNGLVFFFYGLDLMVLQMAVFSTLNSSDTASNFFLIKLQLGLYGY